MKKRVIAVLTAVLMTASLAGCGSGKLSNDYVTVNKYKGLEVTEVAKKEVSDDSVEQEVQSRLEAAATEQDVTDRAAQSGDWVNIDYTGTMDGTAFDGGSATGYDLELGSGSFIGASGDYQDLKTRSWDIIPAKSLISLYSFLRIIRVLILQENRRISTLY